MAGMHLIVRPNLNSCQSLDADRLLANDHGPAVWKADAVDGLPFARYGFAWNRVAGIGKRNGSRPEGKPTAWIKCNLELMRYVSVRNTNQVRSGRRDCVARIAISQPNRQFK